MGAWGTGLYSNDSACDIRGDYIDKLKRGKTNDEATQELINSNRDIMGDVEEEPLFWFALADTQWNYGARHLLTLAQDSVPSGTHIHFDDLNSLEDGSIGLIIEKL